MRYPITTYKRSLNRNDVQLTVDVEALSRLREVFLIVMIAVSVLCCIALYDYAPSVNTGVAYAMLVSFGGLRYVAASLFGYIGITMYLHWNRSSESDTVLIFKLFGIALVFLSLDYIFGKNGQGGLLGNWLVGMLPMDAGVAWALVIAALISGIFLMTRLSWYQLTTFFYYFCQTFIFFKTKIVNRRDRIISSNYDESREVIISDRTEPSLVAPQSQLLLNDPIATQLSSTLQHFGIKSIVSGKETGLAFTRYEVHLAPGLKSSTIVNLRKDIARSLLVQDVKIIEVIPGKACIGIEIPNANRAICNFADIQHKLDECDGMGLPILLGKTVSNEIQTIDLEAMPHLLIAGRTGSGKTMLLQAILMSLTSVLSPDELQIILIDPKRIAFSAWQNLPHLYTDIITEASDATAILNWCVAEMENRYKKMAENPSENQFSKIVVIIDEFADLRSDTEDAVIRLSRKARQSSIHLIAATQRPTIDVITGQIKANISARIALSVSDKRESRIILDDNGAESLLGQGDMLLKSWDRKSERIHAPFVSDDLITTHVLSLRENSLQPSEMLIRDEPIRSDPVMVENSDAVYKSNIHSVDFKNSEKVDDEKYLAVVRFVKETGRASASAIQSEFGIGYPRALKIMNKMRDRGVIGEPKYQNGPCSVLI